MLLVPQEGRGIGSRGFSDGKRHYGRGGFPLAKKKVSQAEGMDIEGDDVTFSRILLGDLELCQTLIYCSRRA